MRFKVDENLPVEVALLLLEAGHEATTMLDQHLGGSDDRTAASICQKEARALVTLDLDFADIQTYPPAHYAGVMVLRLRRHDKPHVLVILG
jgi:predicted nuclease of predicted toxin-antitoxin system